MHLCSSVSRFYRTHSYVCNHDIAPPPCSHGHRGRPGPLARRGRHPQHPPRRRAPARPQPPGPAAQGSRAARGAAEAPPGPSMAAQGSHDGVPVGVGTQDDRRELKKMDGVRAQSLQPRWPSSGLPETPWVQNPYIQLGLLLGKERDIARFSCGGLKMREAREGGIHRGECRGEHAQVQPQPGCPGRTAERGGFSVARGFEHMTATS